MFLDGNMGVLHVNKSIHNHLTFVWFLKDTQLSPLVKNIKTLIWWCEKVVDVLDLLILMLV